MTEFVQVFGDTNYPPLCVAASREFIYVVSTDNQIVQYRSTEHSFVGITETWNSKNYSNNIDIAVSDQNLVFAIGQSSQIRIYDKALNFKEEIKLDLKKFKNSNCIAWMKSNSMLMREDRIYLLLDNFSWNLILFVSVGDWKNINFYFKKEEGNNTIQLILSYLFYLFILF